MCRYETFNSLDVTEYELPYTLETKVPIGSKLVFEKWEANDGKEYMAVELMYQSTAQLRQNAMLGLDDPPVIYPLSFEGIEKNDDGLYLFEDIDARFDEAINKYDEMVEEYSDDAIQEAA